MEIRRRGEEDRQRLEGNGIARPGPDHLIWEDREDGISGMERTERGSEGEPSGEGNKSRDTQTTRDNSWVKGC